MGTSLVRALMAVPVATLRPVAALATRAAEQAIDGALRSELLGRAVDDALRGPLVETVSRDIVRYSVIERAARPLAEAGLAEAIAARILDGPELERIVAQVLESEELWILVEQIVRSPAVTDAIGRQGLSFADQVAGAVRGRSRSADDRVEHVARRLVRRRQVTAAEPG